MVFSSLFFVFAFLVLCYGIYLFLPSLRSRNVALLVFSLVFYAWGGPPLVLLLCLMTYICFIGAHMIWASKPTPKKEGDRRAAKFYLVLTVGMCLCILGVYKYTGFFADGISWLLGLENLLPKVALPIGISFYTFQLLSYVVDVYREETPPQKSYAQLLLYAALFHQCVAGPIVRYTDVASELKNRYMTLDDTWRGMARFTVGLGKKAVLANTCALIADTLLAADKLAAGTVSAASVILGVSAYMLQIYLDFSAYSDMAIGMGLMLGFHFKENFNYPYIATSITDFWRRWHISLSSFFRDYVYIPLGGNRCSKGRHILNLLVVWGLTGFWHGASWNFILWGLYFALFLIVEKYLFRWKKDPRGVRAVCRRVYTLVVVWFGWLLFRFDNMTVMGDALGCLFRIGDKNELVSLLQAMDPADSGALGAVFACLDDYFGGFGDMTSRMTFLNNLFILGVSVVACTPIVPWLSRRLRARTEKGGTLGQVCRVVLNVTAVAAPTLLLILSVLAMVGDSYNPFLYFRF